MKSKIMVNGYTLATLTSKNWNFYNNGKKINKKRASDLVRNEKQVYAIFKWD